MILLFQCENLKRINAGVGTPCIQDLGIVGLMHPLQSLNVIKNKAMHGEIQCTNIYTIPFSYIAQKGSPYYIFPWVYPG